MGYLYLDLYKKYPNEEWQCSIETLITLCIYNYCSVKNVSIVFVPHNNNDNKIPISLNNANYTFKCMSEVPWQVKSCKLPAFISDHHIVTGLCGVLRHLVKYRCSQPHEAEHPEGLLGFRNSCLQAPNEVSVWTHFCEIEIIQCTNDLLRHDFNGISQVPAAVAKFENHLNKPLRVANVYKVAREMKTKLDNTQKPLQDSAEITNQLENMALDQNVSDSNNESINITKRSISKQRKWKSKCRNNMNVDTPEELMKHIQHSYSEGPFITLADIILYTCYSLIFHVINFDVIRNCLPKTTTWFERFQDKYFENIHNTLFYTLKNIHISLNDNDHYIFPEIDDVSLYKCDPKRHNPKKREFTKDSDVTDALNFINETNMLIHVEENKFIEENKITWSDIPLEANPCGGHLPDKRKDRKTQQLENLALCVVKLARDGQKIVDFCCGSGHLGILLGYLLPKCTVILVENKETSLNRASERIKNLGLKNVYLFQCNMDYFIGEFDIGVALHACGVATDLVLSKCILIKASFVVCPCCYGSLHSTETLKYPRSKMFSSLPINKYLSISHAADQTHFNHPLEAQGTLSMSIIDSDRLHNAIENGYNVCLTKIQPLTCTPKNMLLVGTLQH